MTVAVRYRKLELLKNENAVFRAWSEQNMKNRTFLEISSSHSPPPPPSLSMFFFYIIKKKKGGEGGDGNQTKQYSPWFQAWFSADCFSFNPAKP